MDRRGAPKKMTLRQLREHLDVRQQQLAPLLDMTQSELSKVERRGDHRVSTLRRVVEALDGELEIIVMLGKERFELVATEDTGAKKPTRATNKKGSK